MKQPIDQHDSAIDSYFAEYRKQHALISSEEARGILDRRIMQQQLSRQIHWKTIMYASLAALLISGLSWFALHEPLIPTIGVEHRHRSAMESRSTTATLNDPTELGQAMIGDEPTSASRLRKQEQPLSPSDPSLEVNSSPDQLGIVELPASVLAELGIVTDTDSSASFYVLQSDNEVGKISVHGNRIDLLELKTADVPNGIRANRISPVLITTGAGRKCFYSYSEDSVNGHLSHGVSAFDNSSLEAYRRWLMTSPIHQGYSLNGYSHVAVTTDNGEHHDTVTINIAKDVPTPPDVRVQAGLNEYPEAVRSRLRDLTEYFVGHRTKPQLERVIAGYVIRCDTTTYEQILASLDHEEQQAIIRLGRSALEHTSSLVPIRVSATSSHSSKLTADDYIFWYEATPELRAVLRSNDQGSNTEPESQPDQPLGVNNGAGQRSSQNAGGVLSAIAVRPMPSQGELTVRLKSRAPSTVQVRLLDLTGKVLLELQPKLLSQGDGEMRLNASSMPDGVYLLNIMTDRGEQHTLRVVIMR